MAFTGPLAESEPASPFAPGGREAHAEGYVSHNGNLHPFHGYYFRILTRQGKAAADGKMNYMSHGMLAGGFALVASSGALETDPIRRKYDFHR